MSPSKARKPKDRLSISDSSDWQSYNSSQEGLVDTNHTSQDVSFVPRTAPKLRSGHGGEATAANNNINNDTNGPFTACPAELASTRKDAIGNPNTTKTLSPAVPHPRPTPAHVTPDVNRLLPSVNLERSPDHARIGQARPCIFLLPPPSLTPSPNHQYLHSSTSVVNTMNPAQGTNVPDLLVSLSSAEDATRKMAAFKLQTLINDPTFSDQFVAQGGLLRLRELLLIASGNTLAYGLASFARLLEVDQGWDGVNEKLVKKAVELVVSEPLVNILRGALSVLVSVVSRPPPANESIAKTSTYIGGFKTLKPAIALHPEFLEMLVGRLSSADHSLCANALQLINSLMRDAITHENEQEWPKFIKRIQDLGVIKAVYILMQSSALQDLAAPLLDFQELTKVLLRRWREVAVNLNKPEHRRTIKALHLSSNPEKSYDLGRTTSHQPRHNPNKWRRLGFTSETPEPDFEEMGFLGMMDLSDYVRKHQEEFQNILLEQSNAPAEKRCPVARASLIVTTILFEHFEVDKTEIEDAKTYLTLESRANLEAIFKPLLLHWSRLHVAGFHAFLRLWKSTGADVEDFAKIIDLVRILIESVVGGAERTKGVEQIEQELASFDCLKLRELQMELLELTYEDIWGQQLRGIREELRAEALQFVKEQRIRCLLEGAWFPNEGHDNDSVHMVSAASTSHTYHFIRLSPDRKYLHFGNFENSFSQAPALNLLRDRIDLSSVSSVVSNVTASDEPVNNGAPGADGRSQERYTTTKISIHGYSPEPRSKTSQSQSDSHRRNYSRTSKNQKEVVLLTFQPENHKIASEWLDGLLMLLEQQPITAETNKLISMICDYGLKVRLLNVRFNDEEGLVEGMDAPPVPSRDGLDEDYYYEM